MSIDKNHVPVAMTPDGKREALARRDAEMWDESDMYDIAMEGCWGYNNMNDEEVENLYSTYFDTD